MILPVLKLRIHDCHLDKKEGYEYDYIKTLKRSEKCLKAYFYESTNSHFIQMTSMKISSHP